MEVFVGTIMTFGFNFAPSQWQLCNGQTLGISQNQALFALIGTNFGGNGTTTFQLPNLQSRSPLGFGQGIGLSTYTLGQASGVEQVSLTINNLPQHTHIATFTPSGSSGYKISNNTTGNLEVPTATNNVLSGTPGGQAGAQIWGTAASNPSIPLGGGSSTGGGTVTNQATGNGLPAQIMNPYLALNFSIALFGLFPSRN
jgi:microcystin-dependent protein